jgi:hypothetical protein
MKGMKEMKRMKGMKRMSTPEAYPVNNAGIYPGEKEMNLIQNKIMRKIICMTVLTLIFISCEDFLDSQTTDKKMTSNYPSTPEDATQLLTGAYSTLSGMIVMNSPFMVAELRSDDRLGGGGAADISTRAIAQYQKWSENGFENVWRTLYSGIFRSNTLLEAIHKVKWENETQRNILEGEARYLRAHYYFELSRMFGDVCLVKESKPINIPRSPAEETYAFIASDLKTAIEILPAIKYSETISGHATRWAAEALMARVFLFYTGYYNKETLPAENGGEVTKPEVIDWLTDCIDNSGHDLVGDFRNLWPYSYVQDYSYTKENGLKWEGDGNKETVFSIKYSSSIADATWSYPEQKSNQICLYFGLRNQPNYVLSFPYGEGWGFGTVNPNTWNQWPDEDVIRKKGSIFNANDRTEIRRYVVGVDQIDETAFYQKKYMPVNVWANSIKTSVWNYSVELYQNTLKDDYMRNNTQDLVLIRFADVLLMAAELEAAKAQDYLDRVRNRVHLPSVPATLENIKAERRFELAFEGIRFYDLLRWHDEEVLTENQKNIPILLPRGETKTKTIVYRPETNGFLQIPTSEIELSKGVLTPNPGWGGEAAFRE